MGSIATSSTQIDDGDAVLRWEFYRAALAAWAEAAGRASVPRPAQLEDVVPGPVPR